MCWQWAHNPEVAIHLLTVHGFDFQKEKPGYSVLQEALFGEVGNLSQVAVRAGLIAHPVGGTPRGRTVVKAEPVEEIKSKRGV